MTVTSGFIKGFRRFVADLSFEIFLYVGLIFAVIVWWQTGSVYAAIAGFVIVTAALGFISYQLIDAKQTNINMRSWRPLLGFVGVIAIGSLVVYLWQSFA